MPAGHERAAFPPPPSPEALYADSVADYLLKPENLSIHRWERSQRHWHRDLDPLTLLQADDSCSSTELQAYRDIRTGEIIEWKEIALDEDARPGDLSMSSRAPLPPHLATRGSASQLPFLPAGFEEEQDKWLLAEMALRNTINLDDDTPGKFLGEDLLCSAFGETVRFAADGFTLLDEEPDENVTSGDINVVDFNVDFGEMVDKDYQLNDFWTDNDDTPTKNNETKPINVTSDGSTSQNDTDIESYIPTDNKKVLEVVKISEVQKKQEATVTEWAEMIDISQPVVDFASKVPVMAHKYPFELDTFQKQAIIKLEEGNHVFVAAHTSAGKTVVAEYAIALSQNHCTRTIYTSPIKALSNQKYNDFKRAFNDVGLLTGDLQINQTAACLVMTTEILRSMLYCGSDVTRDLEFVIFDEVHYINNAERGHVWEEVLILLPAHVVIVLLSATVPNTLQFADWVGRIKKKKVYVVSTPKRPVPLCHYLYTGSGGKSKNERFMVIDQDGNFLLRGYNDAVAAKESRLNDFKKNFGPKGGRQYLNPKQEQTMWVAFIDHLKSNDKLPVVAFTLSRNRCDQNAESLMSVDLTTAKEKSHIHTFFQRCLQRLKEPDRKLPQVVRLQRVLTNGVGVHHSGILPLLKEIVEMLFQSGHVKILFATETFAMGVNMPARTVVFDEIKKFDGVERRNLAPAEYIQMAGRAGRRGLDATGTVIVLCKDGVPDLIHLKEMMLGTPQKLSSQFRLTYAMILSLLRVATVSVEGMMQRSFREFDQQCQADTYRKQLEQAETEYAAICSTPLPSHLTTLVNFYDTVSAYIDERADIMPILLDQPKISKELVPGKVLLVSAGPYINQLAVFLTKDGPRVTPYKMLLLDTTKHNRDTTTYKFDVDDNWYRMLSLSASHDYIGTEETTHEHTILCVAPKNILKVTKMSLKLEPKEIIQDWEKRQMPRFAHAPVGSACAQVVQELSRLSHAVYSGATPLEEISLTKALAVKNGQILEALDRISKLEGKLESIKKTTDIANFKSEFAIIYERKQAERKLNKLRRLLSYESMALYPDYLRRLEVLRELRYIDEVHRVLMKGRVACEMGTNELIITELVFRNTLTNLDPAEIAALLSCLVFQARTQVEPTFPKASLKSGVEAIQKVDDELRSIESKYLVGQFDALGERLNFGLVRVVYEWAQAKPFAEIMDLTDVQEGIIVRCIQQLNEVLIDVRDAAKIIGDPNLYSKMQEASLAIKRDIVFAASLYTTQKDGV